MSVLPIELLLMVAKHLNLGDCRSFSCAFPAVRGVFLRKFALEFDTMRKKVVTENRYLMTFVEIHNDLYRLQIQKWRSDSLKNYRPVVYSWRRQTVTDDWNSLHEWVWDLSKCRMIVYGFRECLLYCDICKNHPV